MESWLNDQASTIQSKGWCFPYFLLSSTIFSCLNFHTKAALYQGLNECKRNLRKTYHKPSKEEVESSMYQCPFAKLNFCQFDLDGKNLLWGRDTFHSQIFRCTIFSLWINYFFYIKSKNGKLLNLDGKSHVFGTWPLSKNNFSIKINGQVNLLHPNWIFYPFWTKCGPK